MSEASEIAAFGEDHHGQNRGDAGQGAEALVVAPVLQQPMCLRLELTAKLSQAREVRQLQTERGDGRRVHGHGQGDAGLSQLVKLLELRSLVDLAPDQRPRGLDELGEAEGVMARGVGNRKRNATNHSTRVDSQYRAISGKYSGR
jgi:hypothetical protein